MEIQTRLIGDVSVVTLVDSRLDAAQAVRFKEAVREVTGAGANRVILDLSNVAFMDSSGLGAVVNMLKVMGKDRKLELAGMTPTVAKVFSLTRMDKVFTIHASVDDALGEDLKAAG